MNRTPSLRDHLMAFITPHIVLAFVLTSSPALAADGGKSADQVVPELPTGAACVPSEEPPHFVFSKGVGDQTDRGRVTLFATINGCRVSVTARAGSGWMNHIDECRRGRGPTPNGGLRVEQFLDKRGGHHVVQGTVWKLSDKYCWNGKQKRADLYIHSNGKEGTAWNGRYTSSGCVKVDQVNRAVLADYFHRAFRQEDATLQVLSYPGDQWEDLT